MQNQLRKEMERPKIVAPAPLRSSYTPLANAETPDGQVELDAQGRLLIRTIDYRGNTVIESFNHDTLMIPEVLRGFSFPLLQGTIRFGQVEFIKPITLDERARGTVQSFKPQFPTYEGAGVSVFLSTTQSKPLLPIQARLEKKDYVAAMYADLEYYPDNRDLPVQRRKIYMGKYPAMLGSILCHCYGKTPAELADMNEDPNDVFGMLIYGGTEKILYLQQRLQYERIFVIPDTTFKSLMAIITYPFPEGTRRMEIRRDKAGIYRLMIPSFGADNHVNVLIPFAMFGLKKKSEILRFLQPYIPEGHSAKFERQLLETFIDLEATEDIEAKVVATPTKKKETKTTRRKIETELDRKKVRKETFDNLFPVYTREIRKIREQQRDLFWEILRYAEGIMKLPSKTVALLNELDDAYAAQDVELIREIVEDLPLIPGLESIVEDLKGSKGKEASTEEQFLDQVETLLDATEITKSSKRIFQVLRDRLAGTSKYPGMLTADLFEEEIEEEETFPSIFSELSGLNMSPVKRLVDKISDLEKRVEMNNELRFHMLSILLCRLIGTFARVRGYAPSNRDGWENKAALPTGYHVLDLFTRIVRNTINKVVAPTEIHKYQKFNDLADAFEGERGMITGVFEKSVSTGRWGIGDSTKPSENIVVNLIPISEAHRASEQRTLNKPATREGSNIERREAQSSQWLKVGIVRTPEGSNCGFLESLAISAIVSGFRNPLTFINIVFESGYFYLHMTSESHRPVLVNGTLIGWADINELYKVVINAKRSLLIPFDIGLVISNGIFYIQSTGYRLTSPCLIMNTETVVPVIDEVENGWDLSPGELARIGAMEYLDSWEESQSGPQRVYVGQSYDAVSVRMNELKNSAILVEDLEMEIAELEEDIESNPELQETLDSKRKELKSAQDELVTIRKFSRFTHLVIDPTQMMGELAAMAPAPEHNAAPRNTFGAKLRMQAIGPMARSAQRFDTSRLQALTSQMALVQAPGEKLFRTGASPAGNTLNVCIGSYRGKNQEDAVVISSYAAELGAFQSIKFFSEASSLEAVISGVTEIFGLERLTISDSERHRYAHILPNGSPCEGQDLKPGDCIIGKTRIIRQGGKEIIRNASTFMPEGKTGYVSNVFGIGTRTMRVQLKDFRAVIPGSKIEVERSGQKQTVGSVEEAHLLPFDAETGEIPAVFINEHSLTKRMTIGNLIEIPRSTTAALQGVIIDGSAFRGIDYRYFYQALELAGYRASSKRLMIDALTGRQMETLMFMGVSHVMTLKHMVQDKMTSRAAGGRTDNLTHQANRGRAAGGGVRVGEMEAFALYAWGVTGVLVDRLVKCSDAFLAPFCTRCNNMATPHPSTGKFSCKACHQDTDFGIIELPFTMRYLQNLFSGTWIKLSLDLRKISEMVYSENQAAVDTGKIDVIDVEKVVPKENRQTTGVLTIFERARLLGTRAVQIDAGDEPRVEVPKGLIDPIEIARLELKARTIPLAIRRTLPTGEFEDFKIEEIEFI